MVAESIEEMPSISGFDFWGATVVPGKTVKCEITGNILHLTSIAMDENITNDPKQRSVLSVIIDGKQFVLASLREGVCEQVSVDFLFRENKPIKFKVSGKTTLHLVGYLQPLDLGFDDEEIYSDEEDEDEMCDSCDEDSEEGESDEEEEGSDEEMENAVEAGGKKRPADTPVEVVADEKTAKKSKKVDSEPKKAESKPEPKKAESKPEPKKADSKPEPKKVENELKKEAKSEDKKVVAEPVKPAEVEKKQSEEPTEKPEPKKESKKAEPAQSKKAEKEAKKAEKKPEQAEAKKAEAPQKESEQADPNAFRKFTGGVMVKDSHIGEGKVASKGKRLGVMYKGMLKNGKVFDSNVNSNKPFFFKMGNADVIKGWDIGFEGMKVGGKRVIVCPPKMAYGKEGAPPEIPPNSVLVFEVELVNVK